MAGRGFKIADAWVEITTDLDQVRRGVRDIPGKIGPDADRAGRDVGGKLSQGIHLSVVRNSPLIAAGISAALAAGAPVAIAGAGVLFGGIAAVAAAQSLEVRAAWMELGHEIRDGAVSDAQSLIPALTEMADELGASFERLRPQLREAFEATGPLIGTFTEGLTRAAENAMPGLVRAVQSAGPVFDGLSSTLAAIGTGLTGFFNAMSAHAPAAGTAFAAIGDIVGNLLPVLGELLGQGAELASVVLPPLADALGVVADVVGALGPLLPGLALGFAAMKSAQVAAGFLQTFAVQAQYAAIAATGSVAAGERVGGAMSKMADGVGRASAALPVLGIVLSGISSDLDEATTEEERWAKAILEGGTAASDAFSQYESGTHWGQAIDEATGLASSWEDAQAKADELRAQMDPLARAQLDLTNAVRDHGPASEQAANATAVYEQAQADAEAEAGELELAIQGVTQAMVDQANQALAAIDSSFNYRNSVDQLEDAQARLNEAIAASGPGSEEAQRAQLALEEQSYRTALAFGQQQADLSGLEEGTAAYDRFVQESMLASLQQMQLSAGPEMAAAIGQQIAALQAGGVAISANTSLVNTLTGQVSGLTGQIHAVPGQKYVQIDVPTAAQVQQLQTLGYVVQTLPDGSIYVSLPNVGGAEGTLNYTARNRTSTIFASVKVSGPATVGGAIGGIVHAYADGGFEPMRGGIAQVIKPNTWRVIGDRVADDEAYIPINRAQRSRAILEQTAQRMGYGLQPMAGGGSLDRSSTQTPGGVTINGGVTLQIPGAYNLGSGIERRRLLADIRLGLLDMERADR